MPRWGYKSAGMRRPLGGRWAAVCSQIDIADHGDKWAAALDLIQSIRAFHSGAGFRGCDWNAELGRSYGLSPFVVVQVFDHSGPISRGCG